MTNLSIELRPCLSQFLPAGWGGQRISGPRLEQMLWKFATQHLNVALSPGGTVQTTGWTRQRALDAFTGDRRRQAQAFLGPADGVLLEFRGGTIEQAGESLRLDSRYDIESADLSRSDKPEIGPDQQAIIERGLRSTVSKHLPQGSVFSLTCSWEARSLSLSLAVQL